MGCPHLFRLVWPRSYHWDAVHKVDDVDLPRCHSWVKRHPKNLGLSRSKETWLRSEKCTCFFNLDYGTKYAFDNVLKGLTFSISVSKFTLFQLVSDICEFPQPPLWQNLSRQHVHAAGPSIMAQLESRLGFVNYRQGFMLFSQWKGRLFLQIAGYAFLMFANIVNLPTAPFQSTLWYETANIYLQINLLTIICKTWTTMSSPVRSILRQIPWTKGPSKLPARGACCKFTFNEGFPPT